MLTKKDLLDIGRQIDKKLDDKLTPITRDIKTMKSDIKTMKADTTKIRKDMSSITDFFDQEYIGLRKRVERIEDHLNLSSIQ